MSLTASPWHPGFIHTNTLPVFAVPEEAVPAAEVEFSLGAAYLC